MPSSNEIKKDTIYIDVDEEITSIIEKLQNSEQRIVALVLPKRATVLQSVVNMKLLKRTAEKAKKNLVLITSEQGLLPLAGAVGIHVASSLQSRPAVPPAPGAVASGSVVDEDTGEELSEFDPDSVADQSVGSLAGLDAESTLDAVEPTLVGDRLRGGTAATASPLASKAVTPPNSFSEPETIELDNVEVAPRSGATAGAGLAAGAVAANQKSKKDKPAKGKDKTLMVPNFNKFRLALIIAIVAVVLLGGGFIFANIKLSKATISLQTNSTDVTTKSNLTLDPSASEYDSSDDTLPAKISSKQQTSSQQVSATGQKNNGEKASGSVTMSSQVCGTSAVTAESPSDVPSGTGVSSGGKTFITQNRTTFPDSGIFKSGCVTYTATSETDVIAQSAGAGFNISSGSFSVAGRSEISAKSSDAFSGGTDNIVKVISQTDIDSAKSKISSNDSSAVKSDLIKQLQTAGYAAVSASLQAGTPAVTPSAAVGSEADTVTVSQVTTYTMYGIKAADVKKVITASVNKQIDTSKQQILKDGYDQAKYVVSTAASSGPLNVTFSTVSLAGPDIDSAALTKQLAGKKTGDVQSYVKTLPGVTGVDVKYSPFWVSSVPKNTNKIEIVIEKSGTAVNSSANSSDD